VTRAFRQDEQGPLHNPEFTMVEWYRVGDGMPEGMRLLGELCECLLGRGAAETVAYGEAFARHVGIDPHTASAAELAGRVRALGVSAPASLAYDDRDGWLDLLLAEKVQPKLGLDRPLILYDFPASQAALARVRSGRPPVAERFELYVSGIELANGYCELVDPATLRERNRTNNALRRSDGKLPLPEESRLLAAMEAGLPQSTGVALGFDRTVMLAAGASDIRQILAFPFDRA
jgi:lysyl-tRNA synthetase class 2